MSRFLILLLIIPLFAIGQSSQSKTKAELTKTYTQAIKDFIKAAHKKNKSHFDTLYFGNRKNADAEDNFPDIALPETIEKVQIQLISPELGAIKQKEHQSHVYINMIGWVDKEKAEFIFVVFSNGFQHQYDYLINYKYNTKSKTFDLEKVQFKEQPLNIK